ncbi:MAG: hypothetical protein FWF49_05060, partial [Oscillospiraceae bacterium]|nr:hypothetical protein [Oscillospiraceae bacterium]
KVAAVFWGLSLIALLSIPLGLIAHSKLASAYPCKKTLSGFSPEELEKIDKECRDYFSLFDGGCCLLIPTTYVLFVPVNFELAAVPMDKIFNVQITPSKRQRGRYQSIYVWPQLPTYFDIEVMANKEGKIKVRTDGFAPLEFKGRMMDIRPEAEIHIEDYEGLNE